MKLGVEKKGEVAALAALLLIAGLLLWHNLASAPAPAAPAPVPAAVAAAPVVGAPSAAAPDALNPLLRLDKLQRLRAIVYAGTGRDLFRFGPAPPPPAPVLTPAQKAAAAAAARAPMPPPLPPPIPLRFYGYAQASGVPEKIFLQMGPHNYVVTQGDIISHRYRIQTIGPVAVQVKDLQTQSVQELPLERH